MKNTKSPSKFKKEITKKVANTTISDELRLNKYIANSGVCSRRDADLYIQSGNVKVNGVVVTEMGHRVKTTDLVEFDGRTLRKERNISLESCLRFSLTVLHFKIQKRPCKNILKFENRIQWQI